MRKFFIDGRVYFLDDNRIYDLASLPERLQKQLDKPIPEIKAEELHCEERFENGNGVHPNRFDIVHDSRGTTVLYSYPSPDPGTLEKRGVGRPRLRLPQNKIKGLYKQGLGSKAIATRLKREGYKVSYKTVQRLLSREITTQSGQK